MVVSRGKGVQLLSYLVAYTVQLLLGASGHDALGPCFTVITVLVLPLTAVGLPGSLARWRRRSGRSDVVVPAAEQ